MPFPQGRHLLLAVSGGSDSLALLFLVYLLAGRNRWRISVCTIDHGLRADSGYEVAGVQELCRSLDIPCVVRQLPVREWAAGHRTGLEEAARTLRYAVFEEVREQLGADLVCTAHQLDDLMEDVLMRITRGSGWPGLGGMEAFSEARHILRPLLFIRKARLQRFLEDLGVAWYTDQSNYDLSYTRNRFRHRVVPLFLEENPGFADAVDRLGRMAELDRAYWNDLLDRALQEHPWRIVQEAGRIVLELPGDLLARLAPAARIRLYQRAVRQIRCSRKDDGGHGYGALGRQMTGEKLFAIEKAYARRAGGRILQLPDRVSVHVRARGLLFVCTEDMAVR